MVILFIILATVTSVVMYTHGYHITREVAIQEPNSIRGYYAAIAGMRYANLLLKDPKANFGFDMAGPEDFDGETATLTIDRSSALGSDIGLRDGDVVRIVVTEYNKNDPPSTPWPADNYQITSVFGSSLSF
ncbi:MAG: hypothetical protein Q7S30_04545 [Candidatus Omnitrophota bacterium]|nr:hypothetical protein [Candidatus Omnitrophota bacterium]